MDSDEISAVYSYEDDVEQNDLQIQDFPGNCTQDTRLIIRENSGLN